MSNQKKLFKAMYQPNVAAKRIFNNATKRGHSPAEAMPAGFRCGRGSRRRWGEEGDGRLCRPGSEVPAPRLWRGSVSEGENAVESWSVFFCGWIKNNKNLLSVARYYPSFATACPVSNGKG